MFIRKKCFLSLSLSLSLSFPLFLSPFLPLPFPHPLLSCMKFQSVMENFMLTWDTFPSDFEKPPFTINVDIEWAEGMYANLTATSRGPMLATFTLKISHRTSKGRF